MTITQIFIRYVATPACIDQGDITRQQLCEKADIKLHDWYRYYRGEKKLPIDDYVRICEVLDMDYQEVLQFLIKQSKK